jgi:conjugative transfer pilus assembly protein TraH
MKRIKSFALSACLAAAGMLMVAPVAQANMQSTLTGMYSAMGGPTTASLPTGTVLSLGYVATRNTIISPNVIAFAPPNISAGCGGINMFFGSWSFINSQELQQLLTAIGQAAGPFLFQMAIQAMCSQCMSALQTLSDKMQQMNQLAHNSCQLAAGIYSGHGMDMLKSFASAGNDMYKAATGAASDTFDSLFGSNNGVNRPGLSWSSLSDQVATSWGYSALGASTNAPQSGNNGCQDFSSAGNSQKFGNMTWKALVNNNASSAFGSDGGLGNGQQTTEILMSLVGTQIILPSAPNAPSTGASAPANSGANGNSTGNTKSQNAVQSMPYSLTLEDLVNGTPTAPVMSCQTITAPSTTGSGTVNYDAFHGTCGSTGPLSPMGCMRVTTDKSQTLASIGYIGIKNFVHCALFGKDTTGASPGLCSSISGGAPTGIANDVSNPGPGAWGASEQQVINLAPLPLIQLIRPVSHYPSLVVYLLSQAEPFIVANVAVNYGAAVQSALHQGFQNNVGGWQTPPDFEAAMNNINQQVMYYQNQMAGLSQMNNQLRAFVNAFSASQHQGTPGVGPLVGR